MDNQNGIRVVSIPLFQDNYCYLVTLLGTSYTFLIDPADPVPVHTFLTNNYPGIQISHFFITHKHWDHAGKFADLVKTLQDGGNPPIEVYLGVDDAVEGVTQKISEKTSSIKFGNYTLTSYLAPCHTRGHVLYYIEASGQVAETSNTHQRVVFTGDTLFVGGCGRFFEGTPAEMLANFDLLVGLPNDTKTYVGHEYTIDNLAWAVNIELDNSAIAEALEKAKAQREKGEYTTPTTIGTEKQINVFMRCREKSLQDALKLDDPVKVMETLREYKNKKVSLRT